jgi:hypothetical protein
MYGYMKYTYMYISYMIIIRLLKCDNKIKEWLGIVMNVKTRTCLHQQTVLSPSSPSVVHSMRTRSHQTNRVCICHVDDLKL